MTLTVTLEEDRIRKRMFINTKLDFHVLQSIAAQIVDMRRDQLIEELGDNFSESDLQQDAEYKHGIEILRKLDSMSYHAPWT